MDAIGTYFSLNLTYRGQKFHVICFICIITILWMYFISQLSKFDVLDELVLTTWSLGLLLLYANGSCELEPLSNLEQ